MCSSSVRLHCDEWLNSLISVEGEEQVQLMGSMLYARFAEMRCIDISRCRLVCDLAVASFQDFEYIVW